MHTKRRQSQAVRGTETDTQTDRHTESHTTDRRILREAQTGGDNSDRRMEKRLLVTYSRKDKRIGRHRHSQLGANVDGTAEKQRRAARQKELDRQTNIQTGTFTARTSERDKNRQT